jgi:2-polyprenyl-3-methyl-5-hydroxy-6-metoxy-1,4-benzoquinol methylase
MKESIPSIETIKQYSFIETRACTRACNMCGAPAENSYVMGLRLNCSQGFQPKLKCGVGVTVMRCKICDLIYPSPLPVPSSLQDHYGIPPDDHWHESYFVCDPNYFSREIGKAKESIGFQRGMRALDIGAGFGKCMVALARAGFSVEGLEPSASFHSAAIEIRGISAETLKIGSIE